MSDILHRAIQYLPSVGDRRAQTLKEELGIETFGDLLMHIPVRYLDRSTIHDIGTLANLPELPAYVQIKARVCSKQFIGKGNRGRLAVQVYDASGLADLVWFGGGTWVQSRLELEREYIFFGKPSLFNGQLNMVHPEFEVPNTGGGAVQMGVEGVYASTEKLSRAMLGSRAIAALMRKLWEAVQGQIFETLPVYLMQKHNLMGRAEALYHAHFPRSSEQLSRAIYRLKFEELFVIQLSMLMQKKERTVASEGFVFTRVGDYFHKYYAEHLKFELTGAQKRVIREIRADLSSGHQMNRLLQGDVGSGKTIVAMMCMLIAVDNGYQCALMAPTEILARQHFEAIREQVQHLGLRVDILTGSTPAKHRRELLHDLNLGLIDIVIGTHALIEEKVQFFSLGFVVIDEQHRFGVGQRAKLWSKSALAPHVLVMTATPIPRTLAMTLYGDLDVSIIDELPPGRKPIKTIHVFENERLRVIGFIRKQIALGRQVYVVYPMISESEKMDIANLEQGAEMLMQHFPPPEYVSIVVHGKMPPKLKEFGMQTFKSGKAQILVSTTVIEVGVNVPNASVMVIEGAHRFGLSQLHQLRGRVGRGADQSYCVLMTDRRLSTESRKRMETMVNSNDGFELAEIDLQIRGAGDLEGTRQSGQAIAIKVANLSKDGAVIEAARKVAEAILDSDPHLQAPENQELLNLLQTIERERRSKTVDYSRIS